MKKRFNHSRQISSFISKIFLVVFFSNLWLSGLGNSKTDSTKQVSYAAIPMINYSPSLGVSLGAMTNAYYKLNSADTISPSSSSGIFGMYTTNNTYFAAVFQKFYINEDRWRIMLVAGTGNINFQYWQELPIIGGEFIGFSTKANFGMLRVDRKVFKNLYAGINGSLSQSTTKYDLPDFLPDSLKFDKRNMNNIGLQMNYDKREHQVNPYSGFNVAVESNHYRKWLNSGNNFNKYKITYNHFYTLKNERNILATRFNVAISNGEVPFQGQNVVGQDDIRGYSAGKYRNNQVYALQAEYRWRFYKKFGMVGFLGVASAVEKMGDIFKTELLPGAGAGIRYLMLTKERINIGFDVAKGKGDWGMYFRIGESFGR